VCAELADYVLKVVGHGESAASVVRLEVKRHLHAHLMGDVHYIDDEAICADALRVVRAREVWATGPAQHDHADSSRNELAKLISSNFLVSRAVASSHGIKWRVNVSRRYIPDAIGGVFVSHRRVPVREHFVVPVLPFSIHLGRAVP
jgi:hypothetical protein